jgi:ADP-ribose pyrophosphatase YjhB (NUDIX family)
MSTPSTPAPPPRRDGRRFTIPTPADLLHPGQRRADAAPDEADAREAKQQAGQEVGGATPAATGPADSVEDPAPQPGPTDPPAPRSGGPTPATLPRPGRPRHPGHATPPEPRDGDEPAGGTGADATPTTDGRAQDGPTTTDEDVDDAGGSSAGDAVRRMIPNPATLMAAGRGMRKVRPNGLRGRRLPKVEETSAGGVVLDLASEPPAVALIARHDRRSRLLWSLPKGHVEEGETPEEAALREVHEETGLVGRIVAPLGVIDFWFVVEDKRIHKTVHHYVIEAIGGELSDEDIEVEAVEWIPFHQVVRKLAYGDERRLVEKVAQIVPGVK